MRDNNRASEDRLRDLPEWVEGFTENLGDAEVPAPAHIARDSDSERPTSGTQEAHFTRFPKDRNCEVCLQTEMTGAPCRKRNGEAAPRAAKIW